MTPVVFCFLEKIKYCPYSSHTYLFISIIANVLEGALPGLGARTVLQFPAQPFSHSLLVELGLLSEYLS